MRTALEDVEIDGVPVEAGTTVFPLLAAANRDPEVFLDPETIDIRRPNAARHLAFGHGAHFCLGASLARLEGTVALRTLAGRVPQLALVSDAVEWSSLRRLRSLPVRLAG
jgi:cytochrome P450